MNLRVAELWRYPVKSMLGERCEALGVEARGVQGDRLFAIRDPQGKLGSGKHTRRFRRIDGLFGFSARYRDGVPQILFPHGEEIGGDAPSIHQALSDALGLPVTLAREADVSHFDSAPIHLLTTGSLAWLRAALRGAGIDARRFRPNLVIDVPGSEPIEQSWIGKRLRVGEVALQVCETTERCGMVAFAQGELPKAPEVLRHITRHAELEFGVYAQVLVPGIVRLGDPVNLAAE
ncbi:MAG TPA: MOSC domain-containing protein [Rhodanobacteraceae bacterium]|nr:MOSC domain-containing protein [Rhodanobacteraceae bacterium]